ncbi:hypothetical protein SAMN05216496_5659 [Pseudomonas sp. Z003-0.4C(8344-21)]|nr:hypothetical protein SAMN05216496_5659 [Pseudomonas sp. Z003-0.4C(8344-21)]
MLAYCGLRVCGRDLSTRPADPLLQITDHLLAVPSGTNT